MLNEPFLNDGSFARGQLAVPQQPSGFDVMFRDEIAQCVRDQELIRTSSTLTVES